jgi:hypothetical protein
MLKNAKEKCIQIKNVNEHQNLGDVLIDSLM